MAESVLDQPVLSAAALEDIFHILDMSESSGSRSKRMTLEVLRQLFAAEPIPVAQTAHGFSVGDLLRHDGTDFVEATADTESNAVVIGIVTTVNDVDSFEFRTTGFVDGLSGLTGGSVHYLQDAGGLGTSEGTVSKPVLLALSATTAILLTVGAGSSTSGGGGATTFTGLTDTPSAYTSAGGRIARVKPDQSGLEFAARQDRPAYRTSVLPGYLKGDVSCNIGRSNVTVFNGNQYAAWVDSNNDPIIGKRALPDGDWTTFDLSTITGNPFGTIGSSHCGFSVGVDADGYIHVVGNQWTDALKYVVSDAAEDISAFSTGSMVGTEESSVTYPSFRTRADGTLLFLYRDGAAADGDLLMNEYDTSTTTWSRTATIIDGKTDNLSPYWHPLVRDPDNGDLHLFWTWRSVGGANFNSDLSYAYSDDGGTTWRKSDGTAYTLPIRHASAEIVEDTAASGSGLLNDAGAGVVAGQPHASYMWLDGSGYTQYKHAYFNGSSWVKTIVTDFTTTMDISGGTVDGSVSVPQLFTTSDGGVYLLFRHNLEHRGSIRILDVTPGGNGAGGDLIPLEFGIGGARYDLTSFMDRDELVLLLSAFEDTTLTEIDATAWDKQRGRIVTIDLASIPLILAGADLWPHSRRDMLLGFQGQPDASGVDRHLVLEDVTIRNVEPGAVRAVTAPADGAATFTVRSRASDGTTTSHGSFEFALGSKTAELSLTEDIELSAGEWLEIVAPGTQDSALSDVQWLVKAREA